MVTNLRKILRVPKKRILNTYYSLLGHNNYSKLLIITTARSGSNLLVSYLNAHPNARMYGELFQAGEYDGRTYNYPRSRAEQKVFENNPDLFLKNDFFSRMHPKEVKLVGFKIFYDHTLEQGQKSVWPFLINQKDYKIIHLKRKNMLKTFLSLEKAFKTDVWKNVSKSKTAKDLQIELPFEKVSEYFQNMETYIEKAEKDFSGHQYLEIVYEDLVKNKETIMKQVFKFLELPFQDVVTTYKKQGKKTLADSISNYGELKEKFKGSEYEEFFQD